MEIVDRLREHIEENVIKALKEHGYIRPRIQSVLDEVIALFEKVMEESKDMSFDVSWFKFEMEWKEQFDALFDKLWRVTEEEGIYIGKRKKK